MYFGSGQIGRVVHYPWNTTYDIAVTAHSTANTKGSWAQLTSALGNTGPIVVNVTRTGSAGWDALIDIAVGASGSEQEIVRNLSYCLGSTFGYRHQQSYEIPIWLPAGTRVAAKVAATTGSSLIYISLSQLYCADFNAHQGLSRAVTMGYTTADSGGTSVDPGGTANTKGSWTNIASSTAHDFKGFFFCIGNGVNTARTSAAWKIDVAIGATGFEKQIVTDYPVNSSSLSDTITPRASRYYPIPIPAGQKISVRAQCSITDATDRLFDFIIYCFQ